MRGWPSVDAACGGGRLVTSDKAWRTEGGRWSDMVREERQENGNPRCKSVRCALAEERGRGALDAAVRRY